MLGSSELKLVETWKQLERDLERHRPSKGPWSHLWFKEYAWDSFDARQVLEILADPRGSFFAHKEMLFSGLCTWVVCPHRPVLIRSSMLLTMIEHLHKAEFESRSVFPAMPVLADIMARALIPGAEFFRQIYHPINGLRTISRSPSRKALVSAIKKRSEDLSLALKVMQVYHYHADHFQDDDRYRPAALRSAAPAVEKLNRLAGVKAISAGNVEKRFRTFEPTIALAYAASSIRLPSKDTLLDRLRGGAPELDEFSSVLPEWLGRALFVTEEILAKRYESQAAKRSANILPQMETIGIPSPEFSAAEADTVARAFSRDGKGLL